MSHRHSCMPRLRLLRGLGVLGLVLTPGAACGTSGGLGGADAGDASVPERDAAVTDSCIPTCETNACNVSDGCGGMCACTNDTPCIAGTCGGCVGTAGVGCVASRPQDGSTPGTCCSVGYACLYYADGQRCCAVTGQGGCTLDGDCCDFESGVRCKPVADAGAGDSGPVLGRCE
jgi:hypothetical protein